MWFTYWTGDRGDRKQSLRWPSNLKATASAPYDTPWNVTTTVDSLGRGQWLYDWVEDKGDLASIRFVSSTDAELGYEEE